MNQDDNNPHNIGCAMWRIYLLKTMQDLEFNRETFSIKTPLFIDFG